MPQSQCLADQTLFSYPLYIVHVHLCLFSHCKYESQMKAGSSLRLTPQWGLIFFCFLLPSDTCFIHSCCCTCDENSLFFFSVALHPWRLYGLLGMGSPGRPPRLSHSSWALIKTPWKLPWYINIMADWLKMNCLCAVNDFLSVRMFTHERFLTVFNRSPQCWRCWCQPLLSCLLFSKMTSAVTSPLSTWHCGRRLSAGEADLEGLHLKRDHFVLTDHMLCLAPFVPRLYTLCQRQYTTFLNGLLS